MQLYYIKNLVYWQLLVYGVHVGHSFKNSNIYAGWFSYTYRQQVVIINLFKTVLLFKNGYKSLDGTCRHRGSIWFINLHRALELFMNYAAKQCGEFCYSTYWIHGLISNWRVLSNTFRKLLKIEKNAYKGKFRKLELNSTPITFTRFSWPRVSLITSVWSSPFPTKECLYAKVCCIGIVDTNIPGHIANNPIPGNDDSIDSIVFYNTHIAQYILEKKYGFIISWLNKIRVIPRINAFGNWVLKECISNEGGISRQKINSLHFNEDNATSEISKFLIKKRLYLSSFWDEGLKFFFATNSNILTIQEQVDVYEQDETPLDLMEIMFKQRDFAVFHIKTCNLQLFKKRWSKLKQLRKKLRFTNKTIKYKLLNRFYIKKRESWRLQLQDYKRNFWLYKLKKNRLFRTFFRRPKFFRTKGMPRILKYFVLKFYEKYNGCGLFSRYQINLLNISHLSYLLLTYYSKFMKEKIYDNLSKSAPSFWKQLKYRKVGAPTTLTYWKKNVREKILAIVGNNKLNMTIKFNMYYKSFKKIVQFIQRLKSKLYFGFMCYFMMRFWIKREASLSKSKLREYKKAKFLLLRNLFKKNNNKLKILFDIKSMINNKKLLLRKTNVNILLKNNIILRYFKLLTLNYLNNLQKMSRHGIIKKNWSDNRIVSLNSKNKLPKCEISDIKKFFKKFSKKQRSLKLNKKKMIKYSFNVRKLWSRLRSLYNFYKKKLQSNIWVERKKRRKLRRKIKKLNRLKKKTKYQRRLKRRLRRLLRIRVYQRRRYYKPSVLRRHKFPIDIKINRTYIIENLIWIYKILKKYKLLIYSSNNVRKLNIINKYKNKQFNLYKKKINNYKKKKNSILLKNDKYWIKLKKKIGNKYLQKIGNKLKKIRLTWNKLKKIEKTGNDLINLRKVELVRKKILNIKRRKENYHAQIYSIIPYGNKNYSLKYLKKRKVLYKIPKNLWFINRDELKKKIKDILKKKQLLRRVKRWRSLNKLRKNKSIFRYKIKNWFRYKYWLVRKKKLYVSKLKQYQWRLNISRHNSFKNRQFIYRLLNIRNKALRKCMSGRINRFKWRQYNYIRNKYSIPLWVDVIITNRIKEFKKSVLKSKLNKFYFNRFISKFGKYAPFYTSYKDLNNNIVNYRNRRIIKYNKYIKVLKPIKKKRLNYRRYQGLRRKYNLVIKKKNKVLNNLKNKYTYKNKLKIGKYLKKIFNYKKYKIIRRIIKLRKEKNKYLLKNKFKKKNIINKINKNIIINYKDNKNKKNIKNNNIINNTKNKDINTNNNIINKKNKKIINESKYTADSLIEVLEKTKIERNKKTINESKYTVNSLIEVLEKTKAERNKKTINKIITDKERLSNTLKDIMIRTMKKNKNKNINWNYKSKYWVNRQKGNKIVLGRQAGFINKYWPNPYIPPRFTPKEMRKFKFFNKLYRPGQRLSRFLKNNNTQRIKLDIFQYIKTIQYLNTLKNIFWDDIINYHGSIYKDFNNEWRKKKKIKKILWHIIFKKYNDYCKLRYYKLFLVNNKLVKISKKKRAMLWLSNRKKMTKFLYDVSEYNIKISNWEYKLKNINKFFNLNFNEKIIDKNYYLMKSYFNQYNKKNFEIDKDKKNWSVELINFTKNNNEIYEPNYFYDFKLLLKIYRNESDLYIPQKIKLLETNNIFVQNKINTENVIISNNAKVLFNKVLDNTYKIIQNCNNPINVEKREKMFNMFLWYFKLNKYKNFTNKYIQLLIWKLYKYYGKKKYKLKNY